MPDKRLPADTESQARTKKRKEGHVRRRVSLEGEGLEVPCPAPVCSLGGQRQTAREAVRAT